MSRSKNIENESSENEDNVLEYAPNSSDEEEDAQPRKKQKIDISSQHQIQDSWTNSQSHSTGNPSQTLYVHNLNDKVQKNGMLF